MSAAYAYILKILLRSLLWDNLVTTESQPEDSCCEGLFRGCAIFKLSHFCEPQLSAKNDNGLDFFSIEQKDETLQLSFGRGL